MRRTQRPAIAWHVLSRGVRRLDLFREEEDFRQFLGILKLALIASDCFIRAYVLMSNHYHFMLYGATGQVTECMKRTNYLYSRYYNRKYGHTGHTFDCHYRSYAQPSYFLMLHRIAYIFLNPVTGGLVVRPEDYFWSGFHSFMGMEGSPLSVDASPALDGLDPVPGRAREKFRAILKLEARLAAARKGARAEGDRPIRSKLMEEEFVWLLERARGVDSQHGLPPEKVAAWWGHLCGIPSPVMARVCGERDGRRVRHWVAELRAIAATNGPGRLTLAPPA